MGGFQLIMLPGWGMSRDIWGPFSQELAADFDLTYAGWEDVIAAEGFYKKALEIVLNAPNQPLALMGWSLGSLVALEIAAGYPGKIAQIILIGGASRFTTDKTSGYLAGWPGRVLEKMKQNLLNNREKTLRNFYRSMFPEDEDGENEARHFLRRFEHALSAQPLGALVSGLEYLLQTDCRDKLSIISAPLLLIHGARDQICPVAASEYILARVSSRTALKVLPSAGHAPFFSHPGECYNCIKQFMTDPGSGGPND
ncbi:MAG: alpha/beta fold hydrolase [Firmicutes bacterium]|nr:alpha/beta fold hydrolase [Bacillota bacterium]